MWKEVAAPERRWREVVWVDRRSEAWAPVHPVCRRATVGGLGRWMEGVLELDVAAGIGASKASEPFRGFAQQSFFFGSVPDGLGPEGRALAVNRDVEHRSLGPAVGGQLTRGDVTGLAGAILEDEDLPFSSVNDEARGRRGISHVSSRSDERRDQFPH